LRLDEEIPVSHTKTLQTPVKDLIKGATFAGRYRIIEELGKGGMGEVYLAEDTNLKRKVAIKVLPQEFALDKERLARFEREARVLASLNHPNIATIHGLEKSDGQQLLVMELVDGETLAEHIKKGPLPAEEAMEVCRQIAEGLESAHEKGIIHRDLKPGNIKITSEGNIKILDFGLAKAYQEEPEAIDLSKSPTITDRMTQPGVILGTAAYMSPEQATGKAVDKRADIWAFGAVLYELLSAHRAFGGETPTDVLARVIEREPDWESVPTDTPGSVRKLLRRCLTKDPRDRLHDIADARIELEDALAGAEDPRELGESEAAASASPRRGPVFVAVAFALVVGVFLGNVLRRPDTAESPTVRAVVLPPEDSSFELHPKYPGPAAVSPDGTRIVFAAKTENDPTQLWIRRVDKLEAQPLAGTENATYPFWSPDSRFIGFLADERLKKIEAAGGPALSLADTGMRDGGTWNQDGVILASANDGTIHRVSDAGGESVSITKIDIESGETIHRHPRFLPDGESFLYLARLSRSGEVNEHRVMLGSLSGEEPRELMRSISHVEVAAGHLWFVREGTLMARSFEIDTGEFTGAAFPVADGAVSSAWAADEGLGYFSISPSGVIAYHARGTATRKSVLTWYRRDGTQLSTVGAPEYQYHISISPDGTRAALQIENPDKTGWSLWTYDLERGRKSRFTPHPSNSALPVWSPDGKRIAFGSTRSGALELYIKTVGHDDVKPLHEGGLASYTSAEIDGSAKIRHAFPLDWSPDGNHLVYFTWDDSGNADLWAVPLDQRDQPIPIQHSPFNEVDAALSPDGRWLVYTSDKAERYEIYVTGFPGGGRTWQISPDGGIRPEWSPKGDELFFLGPNDTLMAAEVKSEGEKFVVGEIHPLFQIDARYYVLDEPGGYAVGPDGERFLVNRVIDTGTTSSLVLMVGWPEEIAARN
jgi:serine/threonine protein kinase/Tol biopolymer transport system component